ncbi:hypothetical protein AABD61_04110 [Edwardsiella piscicida]|uniref:hypothetical protein n=1 Tax=Edwardsiella piscicida TaxID=1263550 RepID=UPI00370D0B93
MEITTINQLIAAGSGLIGACIGACISGFVNYTINNNNHNIEKLSFAAGFVAEVESLQNVIKERKYLEHFTSLSTDPDVLAGGRIPCPILIPDNFARFYNANLDKVGLLEAEMAKLLVQYHQILQALAQDFKKDSHLSAHGFGIEDIKECIHFFTTALSIGDAFVNYKKHN